MQKAEGFLVNKAESGSGFILHIGMVLFNGTAVVPGHVVGVPIKGTHKLLLGDVKG